MIVSLVSWTSGLFSSGMVENPLFVEKPLLLLGHCPPRSPTTRSGKYCILCAIKIYGNNVLSKYMETMAETIETMVVIAWTLSTTLSNHSIWQILHFMFYQNIWKQLKQWLLLLAYC